jgi:ABC-type dipeptide/oligopeptide/nickel transport system ATPase component
MYKVGISGKIGAGKSTMAHKLQHVFQGLDYVADCASFATTLKSMAEYRFMLNDKSTVWSDMYRILQTAYLPFDAIGSLTQEIMQELDQHKHVPNDIKPRKLLQNIGSLGRKFDQDIWVKLTLARLSNTLDFVFIDDLRFPNELAFIDFHIKIDVERTENRRIVYQERVKLFPQEYVYNNHESEKQVLDHHDYLVGVDFDNVDVLLIASTIVEHSNTLELKR